MHKTYNQEHYHLLQTLRGTLDTSRGPLGTKIGNHFEVGWISPENS